MLFHFLCSSPPPIMREVRTMINVHTFLNKVGLCDTHVCTDCNFQGTEQGSEGGQGQIAGNMIIPFA